jgi:hypothetical protein
MRANMRRMNQAVLRKTVLRNSKTVFNNCKVDDKPPEESGGFFVRDQEMVLNFPLTCRIKNSVRWKEIIC